MPIAEKFKTNFKKYCCAEREVNIWNTLPAEVLSHPTVVGAFRLAWGKHKFILKKVFKKIKMG